MATLPHNVLLNYLRYFLYNINFPDSLKIHIFEITHKKSPIEMAKNFILKCMLAAILLPAANLIAKESTPIETFVNSVKQTNNFIPVSNIWQPDNNFDQKEMLEIVAKAQPLTIDYSVLVGFMQQKTTAIDLILPGVGGGTYTIELARYDFLTNDFQLHEMGANNADKLVSYTPGIYYRGVVSGIPGSVAAFSFFNNQVYGIFSIPGEGNYVVAPNTMTGSEFDNQHYILYNDNDLKIKDKAPGCATDRLPELQRNPSAKTTTTANNKIYNNCSEVRCFETADFAMFTKKGGTTNATNYITALFNNKSTLYRNEGILIALKYIQVNTATDPYQSLATNSSTWLNKFGDVTMNTLHSCDIATLFTTHSGNMGGVAWLAIMCQPYQGTASHAGPYAFCNIDNVSGLTTTAFPTYSWDVEVSTHEMGHVVGSPHTHRCCWNPPGTGTTAIDGCYTLEGSCANPGHPSPSVGGTIMSYCHLTSSGINFSNGFGSQPGDTIRTFLANTFGTGCGLPYNPSAALATANRTITANRECTDLTGITYYWYDNNTADQTDDTLVLMVNKNGNNIGGLNTAGFAVSASTITGYGSGTATITTFPTGTPGITSAFTQYAMKRYWKIVTPTEPTSAVEVMFPFLSTDTTDVSGSIPTANPIANYKMYKVNNPIDPNPANNFPSATAANFSVYTNATTASTTNWSLSTVGTLQLAHMKMTNVSAGGTGFYSYSPTAVENIAGQNSGVYVYPNPTNNEWYIAAGQNNNESLNFQLFTADGRLVHSQVLQSGVTNTINGSKLAIGIYFYRIVGGTNVFTGNLLKD